MIEKYNQDEFTKELNLDLAVIGGGVSGVVTAIAAARQGLKVGLMQNRPVYGGPSSSECNSASDGDKVAVFGASDYCNRNAREAGIIEEIKLEFYRRIDDGWHTHWSLVLYDFVRREENISSFCNCEAYEVKTAKNIIIQVKGRLLGSETTVIFNAPLFVDATGDSFIGAAAGADFRMGREPKNEFNESLAPEKTDNYTQGNTILFRAIDTGKPVKYVPPAWAMKFKSDADLPFRLHNNPTSGYWWIESGGTENTIADNEKIYSDLLAALFGVWDHLKNHGDHGAENYVINWYSPFVGKRESRRLLGDYILSQRDVMTCKQFDDQVAYGGWPIDIHDHHGIQGKSHPGSAPPMIFLEPYGIPFRCLYSRNIENLMMPGRNISVSHVALGTTRLMATCATLGQAVGTAAALCKKYNKTPRQIRQDHIKELQQLLFYTDQALPGKYFSTQTTFKVEATSSMPLRFDHPNGILPLIALPKTTDDPCDIPPEDRSRAQILPLSENYIESISILVDNNNGMPVELNVTLFIPEKISDFIGEDIVSKVVEVPAGSDIPVKFVFNQKLKPTALIGIKFPEIAGIDIKTSNMPLPGAYLKPDGCYFDDTNIYCEIIPEQRVFEPKNVLSGLNRTGEKTEMWISEEELPQSLYLSDSKEHTINGIEIIFDTNLNIIPMHGCVPQCVKDYQIIVDGKVILDVKDNYQRRRFHEISSYGKKIELRITATNGALNARVYGIKVK